MINFLFRSLLLVLFMGVISCSTDSQTVNDSLADSDFPEWDGWQAPPSQISIEVEAPRKVSGTDSLNYRIILTNITEDTLFIGGGRPTIAHVEFELELAAVNRNDRIVWSRIPLDQPQVFVLIGVELEPGEHFTTTGTWDLRDRNGQPIPPGNYTLYGGVTLDQILVREGEDVSKEMEFSWPPVRSEPFEIQVE